MADYFTNFSFVLPLNDEAQKQYAVRLHHIATSARSEETPLPADFPAALQDCLEDWAFEVEGDEDGIWLHSSLGGVDAVCAFVQHLVREFELAVVSFEWSHDCSRPRTDAYGGGAAIITNSTIRTMTTTDWIRSQSVEPGH